MTYPPAWADAHRPMLRDFLLTLTDGDRAAADDLVERTLIRAGRSRPGSADPRVVRPVLLTLARRVAMDAIRSGPIPPQWTDGVPAGTVRRALSRLRPDHRRVLTELYSRGRRVDETARVLGVPSRMVVAWAGDALRELRAVVRDER